MNEELETLTLNAVRRLPIERQAAIFAAGTRSLHEYAEKEISPVVIAQVGKTSWESALSATYIRMCLIMRGIVTLDDFSHFQLAAMGARSLFELLLDVKLFAGDVTCGEKFFDFVDVDKFAKAEKLHAFYRDHPGIDPSPHDAAIQFADDASRKARIDTLCKKHWGRTRYPKHWSGVDSIKTRAKDAGTEYELFYLYDYGMESWSVHSGAAGILNLSRDALAVYFAVTHALICRLFGEATKIVAEAFHLFEAQPSLKTELDVVASKGAAFAIARIFGETDMDGA
jgi:hypothetical protein